MKPKAPAKIYRVKCNNVMCNMQHTAIVPVSPPHRFKVVCPVCGWHTSKKDLTIVEEYPQSTFAMQRLEYMYLHNRQVYDSIIEAFSGTGFEKLLKQNSV